MFDFFGTFLDGPLAGSTFGGVINDGSGGDSVGPFLALGGMLSLFCLVWFSTLSWLLGRIRRTFSGPVFQRRLHLGAGCVFLLCATLLFFFHAGRLF